MEDLGVRSCSTPFKTKPLQQADFPEHLKQYVKARSLYLCAVAQPKQSFTLLAAK